MNGTVETKAKGAKKVIAYFVNGETQESKEKELTAKQILKHAGFEPPRDFTLSRDSDEHEFKNDDEVKLHKDERFTATRVAPTPTS
jgi:hypothetical protein